MVNSLLSLIISLLFCLAADSLASQDVNEGGVKVTASIDPAAVADKPLQGTITINHHKQLAVDLNSFKIENKPLAVNFVKDVSFSPEGKEVMSIYEFNLPPVPKGLYLLPEISATVGGKKYASVPQSYAVKEAIAQPPPQENQPVGTSGEEGGPVTLKLENIVEGETTLYPGQRIQVGYRYSYNYGVDLTKEIVPLLEGKGFKKIGGKEPKEYSQGNLAVLEVTQILEAISPGKYEFGPGIIEGRAYETKPSGQKIYDKSIRNSETTPVTLTVIPFPEEGKPSSFKGAVGDFNFKAELETPNKIQVGDKIPLRLTISGTGVIDNVPLPDVCCQPGYSGFFRLSDLPPAESVKGDTKTFNVEMRSLSTSVKEIPSIEFSFFNPKDKTYKTIRSDPIPITVVPFVAKPAEKEAPPEEEPGQKGEEPSKPQVGAIEIKGNEFLSQNDLENYPFSSWWVLLIIPFGIGVLLIQIQMKNYLTHYKQIKRPLTSKDLFKAAMELGYQSPEFFPALQQALLLRLVEKGEIPSTDISIDALPDTGFAGKVRAFLQEMEVQRFSGKGMNLDKDLFDKGHSLYKEMY